MATMNSSYCGRLLRWEKPSYSLPQPIGSKSQKQQLYGYYLETSVRRRFVIRKAIDKGSNAGEDIRTPLLKNVGNAAQLGISLGSLLALDRALKRIFASASIRFPSALFGMFCIFTILTLMDVISSEASDWLLSFFQPALTFIQRWLPLFYVPSLVVIPLAVKGIPPSAAAKIGAILVGGWAATLTVAGYTAIVVRRIVRTEMLPAEPTPKSAPFTNSELLICIAAMVLSFGLLATRPTALGTLPLTASPFLLCATVFGYILGSRFPGKLKKVLHPIVTCAVAADLGAFAVGFATKTGFKSALEAYLTKVPGNPGAGDLLMGFLGSVILSFAFSMFRQRKLVKRHAAEIFTAVITSSIFSLYSTAALGRILGLESSVTRAVIPRCVTVALALPIANLLQASNPSLTAAAVVVTGLIGANFAQLVMDKIGLDDPIARGMATAASAHGLGTAAVSAKEPQALPFCAIAYALTAIFCSLLCSIPLVQRSLLFLT